MIRLIDFASRTILNSVNKTNLLHGALLTGLTLSDLVVSSEPLGPSSRRSPLVISELMYRPALRTDGKDLEFVEIYNSQPWPEDIGGYRLAGGVDFEFPSGMMIEERGFRVVAKSPADVETVYELRDVFGPYSGKLSNDGETIQLLNKSGAVLWETRYRPSLPWPVETDGTGHSLVLHRPSLGERDPRAWAPSAGLGGSPGSSEPALDVGTRALALSGSAPILSGTQNDRALLPGPVLINEIMYHPISDDSEDEFIELHNSSGEPVDIGGWQLTDGVRFTFPPKTVIGAKGYLVIARNIDRIRQNYPDLSDTVIVGNFSGRLSNSGERVALMRPGMTAGTFMLEDEIAYHDGGRWGEWSDGGGSSLELIDPASDNRLASNWRDSDEAAKAEWTPIEFSARLNSFAPASAVSGRLDNLHVILLGKGECLLDEVEFRLDEGDNAVPNPSFERDLTGWLGQGNHETISHESEGYGNNGSLRIRTSGRGDPGPNRLVTRLSEPFRVGRQGRLKAHVRWLRGHPELVLRLNGNYLEAYGRLKVPSHLGTPGSPNSQLIPNAGPAITDVEHSPTLPADGEAIVVTARIDDSDGLAEVNLNYRIDPNQELESIPMNDAGRQGDTTALDGVYSGIIPGQPSDTLVAFHIVAIDSAQASTGSSFPDDAPARECLVRSGEIATGGAFGDYRMWMTQAVFDRWTRREKNSNQPLDVTFVYGDFRAIYNTGAYFAGSVFNSPNYSTPNGEPCDYNLVFPSDDRMLGETDLTLSWPGLTSFPDPTAQSEQIAYWIAQRLGVPFNYRRYVTVHVNGARRNRGSVMEDTQQPSGDLVEQWFPQNSVGELYKMQTKYELNQSATASAGLSASLENITIPIPEQRVARYRWNWGKRAVDGSMNAYATLFELLETMNLSEAENYSQRVQSVVDVEQWMTIMAVERCVGNWDSFGYSNGQNMYFYKPESGKWNLLIWDMDFELGGFIADPPTANIFTHSNRIFPGLTADPATQRFFRHPEFRRAYLRAMQSAVEGPLLEASALLDAKAAAFERNNLNIASPTRAKSFLTSRRRTIERALRRFDVTFEITLPPGDTIETETPYFNLSGNASYFVAKIAVNGVLLPTRWHDVTEWEIEAPLSSVENQFEIQGLDIEGSPIAEASGSRTVVYTGTEPLEAPQLWINEWQSNNAAAVADPADGNFEDWFELYNPNPDPIDLYGYGLSNDAFRPFLFVVPVHAVIPGGGFMTIWADDDVGQNHLISEPTDEIPTLHVKFQLMQAKEILTLSAPDGRLIDNVQISEQSADVVEGRWPDGGPEFVRLNPPTPGASNRKEEFMPLKIDSIQQHSEGMIELRWSGKIGVLYQVESTESLAQPLWNTIEEFTAQRESLSILIEPGAKTQVYYRLQVPSND